MEINGRDYSREAGEKKIDQLLAAGKKARVQYPDGALWLYTPDGRCYKLNNA